SIEAFFLWAFTIEIILRIAATRPKLSFFTNSWNLFDFFIVVSTHLFVGSHFISVLRIVRVLRVLRTISVVPSLQRLVSALLNTIPTLGNIILLMGIIFYIFGVMGTILFATIAPEYFGSLHASMLTLFQIVTLESWASAVMRPILASAPWGWVYFVTFILVGTFVIINLFVGVIVNNVQEVHLSATSEEKPSREAKELAALRQEVAELKELIIISQQTNKKSS
ncbi:MAG: ion transporter, partial [Bacillota bacterium]|nr:ion transporter [Bacillota bacterium]